jgi:hypothetical protein
MANLPGELDAYRETDKAVEVGQRTNRTPTIVGQPQDAVLTLHESHSPLHDSQRDLERLVAEVFGVAGQQGIKGLVFEALREIRAVEKNVELIVKNQSVMSREYQTLQTLVHQLIAHTQHPAMSTNISYFSSRWLDRAFVGVLWAAVASFCFFGCLKFGIITF